MVHAKSVLRLYPEVIADEVFQLIESVLLEFNYSNTPGVMAVDLLKGLSGLPDMGPQVEDKSVLVFRPKKMRGVITGKTWFEALLLPRIAQARELAHLNGYELLFHWTMGQDWKNTPFECLHAIANAHVNPFFDDKLMGMVQFETLDVYLKPNILSISQINMESVTYIEFRRE